MVTALSFGIFVLACVVLPGLGLQLAARVPLDPALVVPLGLVATAGAYWLGLVAGQPWVFFFGVVLLSLPCVFIRSARFAPGPRLRGGLPPWLVLVAVWAATQFPFNRLTDDDRFLLDPIAPYDDALFHVGLARELATGFPPQVPGLSGIPLGYHLGQGLVRAAALRIASVEPYDALSRCEPVLVSLALVLALRGIAARLSASALAVTLAGFSPLATDFSFLFGAEPSAFYWADLLKGNLLFSLAHVNPVAPALAITLGCLIALSRYEAGEGRGWLALAAIQGAALPHFKVFLGAHLLLGLGLAAVLGWRTGTLRQIVALGVVGLPCALMTASLAASGGGAGVDVRLAPFDLARVTRASLDLPPLAGWAFVPWCALWLFASLGLRWLGVGSALGALRVGPGAAAALAVMGLTAWPLGLTFRIAVAEALPGQKVVNDAAYLVEQGGPLLWAFTAVALARLAARLGKPAALSLCVLALPSTVQFVVRKSAAHPDPVPAPLVRAAAALRAAAAPGDVVLQRPAARYPPLPVLLGMQRVPYERYSPFPTQFAPRRVLEGRHAALFRFFHTEDPSEALAIARSLGATYLALYGPDRIRFDAHGLLDVVHEEDGARVYRIRFPRG